jgi:alpha-glucosidase
MALDPAGSPHHDGSPLYVSTRTPSLGETVRVRVRTPRAWGLTGLRSRSAPDREPHFEPGRLVGAEGEVDWWEAPVTIENPVHGYRLRLERADGRICWLNARGLHRLEPRDVDDFRLVAHDPPPEWARSAVLYQVFPDRFARSDAADARPVPAWAEPAAWGDPVDQDRAHTAAQFYGGDLAGIEERLDHLDDLGVTLLYLTPIFPARSNHRYDALSFDRVDPLLGGDEALVSLVAAAHARGIRVIGDLTANHCGDAHEWFRAAFGNPVAPESDFFLWLDADQRSYVSWLGVPSLPKFNWASNELRRRLIDGPDSVVGRWLCPPFSLDGWRIDVANMTGRYRDQDLNSEVRRIIRRTMRDVAPDALLLAESTNDAAGDFPGDAWHAAMTYANFTRPVWNWLREPGSDAGGGIAATIGTTLDWDAADLLESHLEFAAGFPWRVRELNLNALDTHDTPRFRNAARPGAVPVAVGLAMTIPGIPMVWAGDEFGLTGDDGEHSRTPIPWDRIADAAEPIALYRRLIGLRREQPALTEGGIRWLHAAGDALAFARESAQGRVLVVATRSAARLDLGTELPDDAELLHAEGEVEGSAGVATASGPSFAVWRLPGVPVPA